MAITLSDDASGERLPARGTPIPSVGRTLSASAFLRPHLRIAATMVVVLLLNAGCSRSPRTAHSASVDDEWHEFLGTWTALGHRDSIPLGGSRRASIAKLEGSLILLGPSRPSVGFRAEALVLNDSAAGTIGRVVWTDNRGDQVFSELTGEATATGTKFVGTFLGGTGRYSGATGTYEFTWRFLIDTEDGNLQGQSEGLNGRIRVDPARATPDDGGPR